MSSSAQPYQETQNDSSFRETMSNALIITRREVTDSFRDWRIIVPIVTLTFLFPFVAQGLASEFSSFVTQFGADLVGERTIPFLLMVVGFFPISISLVIALETFVGEKERRSLEPLLSTPLSNTELYIGKTLAAMIPPLASSLGGMLVYLTSLLSSELAWRPQPMLIIQIMLLTIVQALVMVSGAVVVSSQTTSTRAANLLASFIILPMAMIVIAESWIMFIAPDAESPMGIGALWAVAIGMFVASILLLRVGARIFNREELLGRSIDSLNVRGTVKRMWQAFISTDSVNQKPNNLFDWYRSVFHSLVLARNAILITVFVFVAAFILGAIIGTIPEYQLPLPENVLETGEASERVQDFLALTDTNRMPITFYMMRNFQVLLGVFLVSIFSFGIAAMIITPLVYGIIGYVVTLFIVSNNNIALIAAAILPHGVVEIPIILLAAAASFQLGAVVTRPPEGLTVGQGWMMMWGRSTKIFVGIVIPGLFIAALLEALVTPQVVAQVILSIGG